MPSEPSCASPYRRILFVGASDFNLLRQVTRALQPHLVTAAPTFDQAYDFLDRYHFDVVVFDPEELGSGSLDFLLELNRELPRVRRVVFSSSAEVEHGFGLAHATLHEPWTDSQLREAILGASDSREFKPIRSSETTG